MIKEISWQNGEWFDIDKIKISIKDRGLRFGDGIFETILIKNKKPILFDEHIKRFKKSASILGFKLPLEEIKLKEIINQGIEKLLINKNDYGAIRINYSRGLNTKRSIKISEIINHSNICNLWIEFNLIDFNFLPINVIISEKEKRNEFSQLSKCKTFSYSQSIQALREANEKNYDDCLILNTNNELCCGTTFNLIIKRDEKWITPRKESGCLPGIMINQLLKLNIIEEDYILPSFNENDILIAMNSLSCRQINKVNNLKFKNHFDTKFFWDLIYI